MFETILEGKTVVLGVAGSITAYKIASPVSMLEKMYAGVGVVMTKNTMEFISPVISESLTGKRCLVETFDRDFEFSVEHVVLAKQVDVFLIASVLANVIGEVSHGIADDMLTTTFLACGCHKVIASTMNTHMYGDPILRDNLKCCESYGMEVLKPAAGCLACDDTGAGKMPELEMPSDYAAKAVGYEKGMAGKKMLVTAGPTREVVDPVWFITNHLTGKMGYAVAKITSLRGAGMTLISGSVPIEALWSVKVVPVENARQVYEAVTVVSGKQGVIVKAAAATDHRPAQAVDEKMKEKDRELSVDLCHTDDILGYLGSHKKDGQSLYGLPMGTQDMPENPRAKLSKKHLSMIVANNLKVDGAGSGTDTSVVTTITGDEELELEKMSEEEVVGGLLDEIMKETAGPT